MSLEQAILDRLEKRNAQIAQLQSTVHALERASDSQREHAIMERGRLLEENKTLAERIERMEESSGSQEALQRKDAEIQEWLMQLEKARNERDAALREAESLRSQVPLESTREALKNTVAKLQEATTRADNIAICRDRWMKIAADCGRMDGEDAGEFMARLAQQSAQGVALAVKVEELRVVNIKQEQELEELRSAKSIAKNGIDESYQVKVLNQLGQTIAYKDRQLMVMVSMYKRIKACRDIEDRIAQMMSITSAIDDADNALSQLTA